MKHYLIQPTWRCQNRCPYCWLNETIRARPLLFHAHERPAADWIAALRRDWPTSVDIAGGEPLLYDGLLPIMRALPGMTFGLSTNGLESGVITVLCSQRLDNLSSINVSYHPHCDAPDYEEIYRANVQLLMGAGYHVIANVVNWDDNLERSADTRAWLLGQGARVYLSPFERMDVLDTPMQQGLHCMAGISHLAIAPDGEAWPCLTALRSPRWAALRMGNWLDGEATGHVTQPCHLNCTDYYTLQHEHEVPDMWGVQPCPA